jgi:hypothetical protein
VDKIKCVGNEIVREYDGAKLRCCDEFNETLLVSMIVFSVIRLFSLYIYNTKIHIPLVLWLCLKHLPIPECHNE